MWGADEAHTEVRGAPSAHPAAAETRVDGQRRQPRPGPANLDARLQVRRRLFFFLFFFFFFWIRLLFFRKKIIPNCQFLRVTHVSALSLSLLLGKKPPPPPFLPEPNPVNLLV